MNPVARFGIAASTILLAVGASSACSGPPPGDARAAHTPEAVAAEAQPTPKPIPPEQPVTVIRLAGPVTDPRAEISSLAWHGDTLVLLPQYPGWRASDGAATGQLFALTRDAIERALDSAGDGRLIEGITPREVPFDAAGVDRAVAGFEGFEAIAFSGDRAYLAIESESARGQMRAFIVSGAVDGDLAALRMEPEPVAEIDLPRDIENMGIESLVVDGPSVLAVYEANGKRPNPTPYAYRFGLDLAPLGPIPFPSLEYRVTDASEIDPSGEFWVLNVFTPALADRLDPAEDALVLRYGEGPTHLGTDTVERLVALRIDDHGVTFADRPPVPLELPDRTVRRNWEGLARLADRGFLIATDTDPVTVLAFVEAPDQ